MADDVPTISPAPSLPDIVQRYLNGESLQALALEHHKHPRTLYRWMLTECGAEYDAIVTECLSNRIADADVMLMEGEDSCQIARAREIARFARMDFERRRPKLYGPKQELEVDTKISITINRLTPPPVVVETVQTEAVSREVKDNNELGVKTS